MTHSSQLETAPSSTALSSQQSCHMSPSIAVLSHTFCIISFYSVVFPHTWCSETFLENRDYFSAQMSSMILRCSDCLVNEVNYSSICQKKRKTHGWVEPTFRFRDHPLCLHGYCVSLCKSFQMCPSFEYTLHSTSHSWIKLLKGPFTL